MNDIALTHVTCRLLSIRGISGSDLERFCRLLQLALIRVNQDLTMSCFEENEQLCWSMLVYVGHYVAMLVSSSKGAESVESWCLTDSLLYCLVISESVASGATWAKGRHTKFGKSNDFKHPTLSCSPAGFDRPILDPASGHKAAQGPAR